jgi:threonine dehydratase
MPFLHPFGPDSIAGAASIGHELADEMPDMTHLVLPVGGGSLLPGAASVVKERLPGVQVVAVQVERCTAYIDSLIAGSPRMADNVDTRFSGIAVGQTQPLNLALGSPLIDQAVVLDPRYAYETVHLYKGETGTLLEDSAAVSLGAVRYLASLPAYQGAKFVTVASGGNPDDLIERYAAAVARRAQENRQFSNRRPEKPPATLVYFTPK